jgi:hypothetical protein
VNLVYGSCRRTKVDHLLIRLRRRRFFSKKDCSILGGFVGCRVTIDDRSVTFWCSEFCKVQLLNHFYLIRELKCGRPFPAHPPFFMGESVTVPPTKTILIFQAPRQSTDVAKCFIEMLLVVVSVR